MLRPARLITIGALTAIGLAACSSSTDDGNRARPDPNCHPPSHAKLQATLALTYVSPTPQLRVPLGSLVAVKAGPFHGQDLTFPGTTGSPVACLVSGRRRSDGAVRVVLLTRHPGRLHLGSGEEHPGQSMDPAYGGVLIVAP